jgi:hypothetical protein
VGSVGHRDRMPGPEARRRGRPSSGSVRCAT